MPCWLISHIRRWGRSACHRRRHTTSRSLSLRFFTIYHHITLKMPVFDIHILLLTHCHYWLYYLSILLLLLLTYLLLRRHYIIHIVITYYYALLGPLTIITIIVGIARLSFNIVRQGLHAWPWWRLAPQCASDAIYYMLLGCHHAALCHIAINIFAYYWLAIRHSLMVCSPVTTLAYRRHAPRWDTYGVIFALLHYAMRLRATAIILYATLTLPAAWFVMAHHIVNMLPPPRLKQHHHNNGITIGAAGYCWATGYC